MPNTKISTTLEPEAFQRLGELQSRFGLNRTKALEKLINDAYEKEPNNILKGIYGRTEGKNYDIEIIEFLHTGLYENRSPLLQDGDVVDSYWTTNVPASNGMQIESAEIYKCPLCNQHVASWGSGIFDHLERSHGFDQFLYTKRDPLGLMWDLDERWRRERPNHFGSFVPMIRDGVPYVVETKRNEK